jgi:SAM-dependent methyltransferase
MLKSTTSATQSQALDYEEGYHSKRHSTHFDEAYYNARARIAQIKFFSKLDPNDKLLDFGCGLGQNILYRPGSMGYDISNFSVDFARSKNINATTNMDEVPNEAFDVVFTAHVLEHHPHPLTMIEDMKKKLKKGKLLMIVVPHERHGRAKFELDLNQHLYMWNFQNLNNLLLVNGFEIVENKYLRGAGYNKLLWLEKINFKLYWWATNILSRLTGIKEILVVARKK